VPNKLISIVILNYNGKKFLTDCIESIKLETNHEYEIIVVDNASPDNSGRESAIKYPECKFILNERNLGVPEGLNIGIKNSSGEFIVLMNNDVKVTRGWLDNFLDAYKNNGHALYQPKFLKMINPEILDGTGDMINIFGFGFARDKGKKDHNVGNRIEEISYASGTCMFLPRKIISDVGYFDQKLFAYHEELDFGWRARLYGYKSFYVPNSIIYHYGSAGWGWSGKKFYFLERNRWIVLLKNYSGKTIIKLLPSLFLIEIILLGFFTKKGLLKEKLLGYAGILNSLNHIIKSRKVIQSNRKISDDEIIKAFYSNIYIPPESEESQHTGSFNKILIGLSKLCGLYEKLKFLK